MSNQIQVIQYGLGAIGSAAARLISERDTLELVGGVDNDPAKVGRDVGEVIGLGYSLGFPTTKSLPPILERTKADIVVHTTSSYFELFKGQLIEILENGLDAVSISEELAYPWRAHPTEAEEIDAIAKRVGKTVLGTGVNPGFLMDSLPLYLTAICQGVEHVSVSRVINASTRRKPFQAKIGSGMRVEDFKKKIDEGRMGHVGLPESMHMLFERLGKELVRYESGVEPVIAEELIQTEHFEVQPGQVRGLREVAKGYTADDEFVALTFTAALAQEDDGDTIHITGKPNLTVRLHGTNGDLATVAMAVNAIDRVLKAGPGLKSMLDIPLVTIF